MNHDEVIFKPNIAATREAEQRVEIKRLRARVAELEARLAEEVMDRDHWKAFAESLDFPKPE